LDTLISNVTIVTMNDRQDVLFGAHLGIRDGKIAYIGKTAPEEKPQTIVDGTGMVLMPGLVNCHTHLAASVLRSYCDDLCATDALTEQLKREARMDSRCAKAAASLAIAECLRFGITSVSDLYYYPDATAEAVAEAGIKANLSLSAYRFIDASEDFDFETDEQCRELQRVTDKWHGYDNGRIRIDAGIHAEYTSNHRLWEGLAGYAAEKELRLQLHLSQTQDEVDSCLDRTGLTPPQLLDCHGIFHLPTTAAGCGCLTPEDQALLGRKKATAVATPISDGKAARPVTPILSCVKAGMNVALGTGGAQESGNLDMFPVMRAAALSQRTDSRSVGLPATAALMMATTCGAQAQGRAADTGMIRVGFDADLCLVDFSAPHLIPCHNVLNALVYSAQGGDVAMTMVRGKILYQNGKFPTIDLPEAVAELTNYAIARVFTDDTQAQ